MQTFKQLTLKDNNKTASIQVKQRWGGPYPRSRGPFSKYLGSYTWSDEITSAHETFKNTLFSRMVICPSNLVFE